eukprot:7070720-Ditylum_brightwellii.AAC.1
MMLGTEKWCRCVKTGYMWSLKLAKAARTVRYWRTRKSDSLNRREESEALLKVGNDLGIYFQTMEISLIASKLTAARKDLRKAEKMAAGLRDEYLEEMAQLQINSRNTNLATIIKNIHQREEVKTSC